MHSTIIDRASAFVSSEGGVRPSSAVWLSPVQVASDGKGVKSLEWEGGGGGSVERYLVKYADKESFPIACNQLSIDVSCTAVNAHAPEELPEMRILFLGGPFRCEKIGMKILNAAGLLSNLSR